MTIIEFINENALLKAGDRVLCAVSGGADSMCLLHYLHTNAEKLGISVCAASFDHMLRGEASARDCEFVAAWCRERDIPCVTGCGDVRSYAFSEGMSEEEAARGLRYAFLKKSAAELGCTVTATAHNANDNAETMLFNLTRGGGLKGLCGIPPERDGIIRPLLSTTREQIERYNEENSVPFVTDATNLGDDYTRNILRHHVTPVLESINPAFFTAAARTALSLREDERCLEEMARAAYDKLYKNSALPADKLMQLPKPVAMRVIRMICGRGLSYAHAQAVYALPSGNESRHADIPGMRVTYDRGVLYFGAENSIPREYALKAGQRIYIPESGLEVSAQIIDNCERIFKSFNILDFKCDSICGNISLTPRKSGDKIRLSHRKCTKSLKDLFNESGMSLRMRELTPVLRDEKGVIGVYGFGIDERCIARTGDRVLRVTINKTNRTGDN